jgi:hypothetical protein
VLTLDPRGLIENDIQRRSYELFRSQGEERAGVPLLKPPSYFVFSTRIGLMPIGTFESVMGTVSPSRVRYCL